MKQFLKWITILGILGALSFTGLQYWQEREQNASNDTDAEAPALRYKEYTIKRGRFEIEVKASGLVKPINRIEIKSKASGKIIALPVEEGDFVKKGSLIAKLDQRNEASAVALAEADLATAKAQRQQSQRMFARRDSLFKRKIISEEERDETSLRLAVAQSKVLQATTTLDRAKDQLGDAVVRAPISGIILQKYVEKGQIISSGLSNVSGGTPIVDIAAMQQVFVEAGIDEIDIGKVKVGQSAEIVAEAYPNLSFGGTVIRIAPEAKLEDNVTLFDVIIRVENKAGSLKSGMNARIKIKILEKKDVVLAPVIALTNSEGDESSNDLREVQVKQGERFVLRTVTIGLEDFKHAEILSGLKEGDVLGVPMRSRLKRDNDRLEKRIKKSRSFGVGKKKK